MKEMDNFLAQGEKIQAEINKLGIKIQKEKEKAALATIKLNIDLNEFEIPTKGEILDKEKNVVELTIIDQIEEYKEAVRKKRLEEQRKGGK